MRLGVVGRVVLYEIDEVWRMTKPQVVNVDVVCCFRSRPRPAVPCVMPWVVRASSQRYIGRDGWPFVFLFLLGKQAAWPAECRPWTGRQPRQKEARHRHIRWRWLVEWLPALSILNRVQARVSKSLCPRPVMLLHNQHTATRTTTTSAPSPRSRSRPRGGRGNAAPALACPVLKHRHDQRRWAEESTS